MNAVQVATSSVRAAIIGAVKGLVSYPARVRRGEVKLPRRQDFRPTRPGNWSIRTRLLMAVVSPVALVAVLDGASGHLSVLTVAILIAAIAISIVVAR